MFLRVINKIPYDTTIIKSLSINVILLFVQSCCMAQQSTKPNILLINVDDMGWKDPGYMGSRFFNTPNIDSLSKLGMIFTQGYAAASNCAPSRASLMTGLSTARHGVLTVGTSERGETKDRKLVPVQNKNILPSEFITLPQVMKDNGYVTCHSGKWHISKNPLERGFDINIGGGNYGNPGKYYPPYGIEELKSDESGGKYLTDLLTIKTIEFIRTKKWPFFLNYAPYAVHTPITAVDSLKYKYKDKPVSNGQGNIAYATMIENLDMNIGFLIKALKESGAYDNTFIIFTSDNGGLFGITKQPPLRSGKGSYYEGGIRVPFFFVWKAKIKFNTSSEVPITNMDIFPTVLDVAGIDKTKYKLDGQSLRPLFKNERLNTGRPLFWHFPIYLQAYDVKNNEDRDPLFRTRPGSVVRSGNWKLHHYYEDDGIELYNLDKDISEKKNLASSNPKKANELLALLNNWRKEVAAPAPTKLNPDYNQ